MGSEVTDSHPGMSHCRMISVSTFSSRTERSSSRNKPPSSHRSSDFVMIFRILLLVALLVTATTVQATRPVIDNPGCKCGSEICKMTVTYLDYCPCILPQMRNTPRARLSKLLEGGPLDRRGASVFSFHAPIS
jgi:hypothetical protein